MTKALVFCLLALAPLRAAEPSYMIKDGQSLKTGLDLFEEFYTASPSRRFTSEETVSGIEAATYTQAFASACYMWQTKFPDQAPFKLSSDQLKADQFAKIVHKYLNEHSDRLHERAEFLVFDAVVAACPRK